MQSLDTRLSSSYFDSQRFSQFQSQMQSELGRLNDMAMKYDSNMKLLAEGTLTLSEKDKQYSLKVDTIKKDLQSLASAIETRIDSKLYSLENGQQVSRSTLEQQVDMALKRYGD